MFSLISVTFLGNAVTLSLVGSAITLSPTVLDQGASHAGCEEAGGRPRHEGSQRYPRDIAFPLLSHIAEGADLNPNRGGVGEPAQGEG